MALFSPSRRIYEPSLRVVFSHPIFAADRAGVRHALARVDQSFASQRALLSELPQIDIPPTVEQHLDRTDLGAMPMFSAARIAVRASDLLYLHPWRDFFTGSELVSAQDIPSARRSTDTDALLLNFLYWVDAALAQTAVLQGAGVAPILLDWATSDDAAGILYETGQCGQQVADTVALERVCLLGRNELLARKVSKSEFVTGH